MASDISPSPTPTSSQQSEAGSLGYASEDGSFCYLGLVCEQDAVIEDLDAGFIKEESVEIEVLNDLEGDWMYEDIIANSGANQDENYDENGGMVVDPNTQDVVEESSHSVVSCRSIVSSTELIDSLPSESLESVERYFHSSPAQINDSVSVHSGYSPTTSKLIHRPKANTVKRVIMLNPGEDPETATSRAIHDIAQSLNQKAAERLAQGHTPEKETVIEITRIKAPSEGYFSRENILRSQRERLISGPCQVKAAAQKAPASSAILQARLGKSSLGVAQNSSVCSIQIQGQQQTLYQHQPHQHRRRKSPHPKKHMYTSPEPPRVPKPPHMDLPDGCYYAASTRIQKTVSSSSSSPNVYSASNSRGPRVQAASQALYTFGTHKLTTEGKLNPMTTTYAAPTSKGPSILRSSSTLRQGLPKLKQHSNTQAANTNQEASQLDTSLTNIQWLGHYTSSTTDTATCTTTTNSGVKVHRDIRLIATDKQIDKISRECGRKKRPPYSYMHLIQMAICSRLDKRMTLREIYRWIEDKFPYYKYSANQGWKNSIRHNLSLYDIFVREKHNLPGKSGCSYWTLRADLPLKTSKRLSSLMQQTDDKEEQKDLDVHSSSPLSLGSHVQVVDGTRLEEDAGPPVRQKKAPVPLLPKPPSTSQGSATSTQTYALIPIQNGMPVIPNTPLMVSSWQLGSSPQLVLQDPSLAQPHGLVTPKKGFKGHKSGMKVSLKRNLSPTESSGGSSRKLVKISPKINVPLKVRTETDLSLPLKSPSSVVSSLGNSLDTSDLQQQFSQIKFDSGIDLHTDVSSLSEPPSSVEKAGSYSVKGLPKPKMYYNTRCRSRPASSASQYGDRTPTSEDGLSSGEKDLLGLNENSPTGAGLHDILASIEKDLSTPMRRLLQTPPKSDEKNLLTSTPFRGVFGSPSWSPIKGLTPINLEPNIDAELFTPEQGTSKRTSTPFRTDLGEHTPPLRTTPNNMSPGLRTLRGTPLRSPRLADGRSPNSSFAKLLGEFHLDSMIDEGINADVSNLSFSAFQCDT